MKKILTIILTFIFVLPLVAQKDSNTVVENDLPKNKISCDFEFLAVSFSYHRKISSKLSIGGTFNFYGLALGIPWYNKRGIGIEFYKVGLIFSYEFIKNWSYEVSPQFVGLSDGSPDGLQVTNNGIGVKNELFKKWGRVEFGVSVFVGKVNNGFDFDDEGNTLQIYKWTTYNSFLIIRVPLTKW
jgi:hypothetical protein